MKKFFAYVSMRSSNSNTYYEKRDAISYDWINYYEKNLISPIFVPNSFNKLESFLNDFSANGLILTNGDDINENYSRKKTEQILIKYSIQKKIPIIGFCRGFQMLNDYFGGRTKKIQNNSHSNEEHKIKIIDSLNNNIKTKSFSTKCYHNFAITNKTIAKSLVPFAISQDGLIEGAYHKSLPIIGIQWHPERQNRKINEKILNFWKRSCT